LALFFEDALVLLRDAGVRHVIVGGTAVILHGVPRTTDLDLVVEDDPANMRRLVSVMNRLGYRPRAPVDPAGLSDPEVRRSWIEEKGMRSRSASPITHCPTSPSSSIARSHLSWLSIERSDGGVTKRLRNPQVVGSRILQQHPPLQARHPYG
jgi:hypothetical protein